MPGYDPSPVDSINPVPAGKVVGQTSPLASGPQPVENGVERFPVRRNGFSSLGRLPYVEQRFFEQLPFGVGQVGVVEPVDKFALESIFCHGQGLQGAFRRQYGYILARKATKKAADQGEKAPKWNLSTGSETAAWLASGFFA